MAKKFCVLTPGRCGSTSLIYAIGRDPDVALPSHDLSWCIDEELVHPNRVERTLEEYGALAGKRIRDNDELVQHFFQRHEGRPFVGFKTMPTRHNNFGSFAQQSDITYVTVTRTDFPSMVASLQVAKMFGTWRRSGERQRVRWKFTEEQSGAIQGTIRYLVRSERLMQQVKDPIRLTYEEMVQPNFKNEALDQFFGRPIRLDYASGAIVGSQYVDNWDLFCEVVQQSVARQRINS